MWMKRPRISFADFQLPFLANKSPGPETEQDDEEDGTNLEDMEGLLPKEAIFLGSIDDEVSNWTSWKVDDHYYLLPWDDGKFDWALFRITWDDNWCRYDWSCDARISGVADPKEAARRMLRKLFAHWEIDLRKSTSSPYRDLLE